MPCFYTKKVLYARIDRIRQEFNVQNDEPISNVKKLLTDVPTIKIASVPFETTGLHGMCSFGKAGKADIILLNSNRSNSEQNFDCMHEYIHIHEHRNERKDSFRCYEKVTENQNSFLEWQANEGAAESLVPYRDFIPRFYNRFCELKQDPSNGALVRSDLARFYHVSNYVIENRLYSLSYEIDQYSQGVPINQIIFLSHTQQRKNGIQSTNYNAECDFIFYKELRKSFAQLDSHHTA